MTRRFAPRQEERPLSCSLSIAYRDKVIKNEVLSCSPALLVSHRRLLISSILGVVLEDERLEVSLFSLDQLVFCTLTKRIARSVEQEGEEPQEGLGMMAVLSAV